jgi:nitrogen fixation/metabolism regulation signal transduction histidine kinase
MKKKENNEVAFFGKITAGITHEINNVLAIIKESTGLMEDLMSLSKEAHFPYQEKFQKALSRIKDQVDRGTNLTGILNKFAHSSDKTIAEVDLHELTEQVVALSQRFARLQCVTLAHNPSDQPLTVVTQPVQLQMAIFTAIQCCLDVIESGGAIKLCPQKIGVEYGIHMVCQGDLPSQKVFSDHIHSSEKWTRVQQMTLELRGLAKLDESNYGIYIYFPYDIALP